MIILKSIMVNMVCVMLALAATKTVKLNSIISTSEARGLWPSSSNTGKLFYGEIGVLLLNTRVVYFDKTTNDVVTEFNVLPQKRYSMIPVSLAVNSRTYACVYNNPANGRYRIGVFDNNGNKLIVKRPHHTGHASYKVFSQQEGEIIYLVSPHLSGYEKALDLYDENSMTPSQYSSDKFDAFFRENKALTIWKHDEKLELVDSTDVISRTGVDLKEYLQLYDNQAVDQDKDSNIHLIHSSNNYLIRSYSPSLQLEKEFRCENDDFNPIPNTLFIGDAKRLKSKQGNYSIFYALYSINDWLVTSFYQNPEGWERPEGPYYFDIHSKDGEKRTSGQLPYPFFGRDDEGNMYLYVMKESDTWLGDDEYYLVEISIAELIAGKVSQSFVLNRIKQDSND